MGAVAAAAAVETMVAVTEAVTVALGLGSNLGRPAQQIRRALSALNQHAGLEPRAASALYSNPPMGPADQPDYVNAVAIYRCELEPLDLLDLLQSLEAAHGRGRGRRWGERTLDLDLLVYGDREIDHPRLRVPHPGLRERAFVLYPLAEIAPSMQVPGAGVVEDLAEALRARAGDGGLRRLEQEQ